MKSFQSAFAEHLSAYIKLRHALGFRSEDAVFFLEAFDRRVFEKNHTGPLTQSWRWSSPAAIPRPPPTIAPAAIKSCGTSRSILPRSIRKLRYRGA